MQRCCLQTKPPTSNKLGGKQQKVLLKVGLVRAITFPRQLKLSG